MCWMFMKHGKASLSVGEFIYTIIFGYGWPIYVLIGLAIWVGESEILSRDFITKRKKP